MQPNLDITLSLILDNTAQGFCFLDRNCIIIYANQIAKNYAQDIWKKNIQIGENFLPYIAEADRLTFIKSFRLAWQGRRVVSDYKTKEKYVGDVWYHVQYVPVYDTEKTCIGVLFSLLDITPKKKSEIKILQQKKQLKSLIETRDKFISIIAHDIKGPLHALLSFANLITEEAEQQILNPEEISYLGKELLKSTQNLYNLLDNLLHWANAQRDIITPNLEPIALPPLIEDMFQLMQPLAKAKQITLSYHNTVEECSVVADKEMLKTILRNLITNAVKFTKENGKIDLHITCHTDTIHFALSDTGIGMTPQVLEKLFRIDTKISTKGTANEIGTGLGLVLCKEFLQKLGGSLNVESEVGKGTTFSFALPKYL
ncbi:MAG: PAS domain-containing sensor histidine kinase [Cytophagales bacterium]|nr:MAG: PAS domain-containing sensor histidine kinase [Cytophagales bacterium]